VQIRTHIVSDHDDSNCQKAQNSTAKHHTSAASHETVNVSQSVSDFLCICCRQIIQVKWYVSQSTAALSAVCRCRRLRSSLLSRQESTMCDIVWISLQSHISLSVRPHFFWHVPQWPCLSGNSSVMTNGIRSGENWVVRLWDRLQVRSWSLQPTASLHATDVTQTLPQDSYRGASETYVVVAEGERCHQELSLLYVPNTIPCTGRRIQPHKLLYEVCLYALKHLSTNEKNILLSVLAKLF